MAQETDKRSIVIDTDTDDLFSEEQAKNETTKLPWWQFQHFLNRPALFGTWDGVFVSVTLNTFGVIVFLRSGWTVANAGIVEAVLILLLSTSLVLLPVLSAIGVSERCRIQSGGVYFIVSHVLGGQLGTAVGLVYAWGQAIAGSLIAVGFGESMASVLKTDNLLVVKTIAASVVIILAGVNMAGVKWVVKVQLILFILLVLSIFDFTVGSFVTVKPDKGITSFNLTTFRNNSGPSYERGENFFTVFGVYFSTFTGVLSGVNMSGDLKNPIKNIPTDDNFFFSYSSLLCFLFLLSLAAKCQRRTLFVDWMVAEEISWLGVLFLCGLYVSSLSCILGGFYSAPRILQSAAQEKILPSIEFLSQGFGPNKSPFLATIVVTVITFLFIFVAELNTLAKISTIPYLITYAFINYSYVHLAMTFDLQQQKMFEELINLPSKHVEPGYGSMDSLKKDDLKKLFQNDPQSVQDEEFTAAAPLTERNIHVEVIYEKINSWYGFLVNRWSGLIGVVVNLVIVLFIDWLIASLHFLTMIAVYLFIGWANPAISKGVTQFNISHCIKTISSRFVNVERIRVVSPENLRVTTKTDPVNEDNEDFKERSKYHKSQVID
uniref:Amino acid permease/ SLC12A domain-containing protein n=1 Tax=Romanomermis culicivorax TaxID=13658 RepID=A0A915K4U4_ROMCU